MSTTNYTARFNEVAACSCAEMLVRQLMSLNTGPTGKQWARQREQRRDLWQQIADTATHQANALGEAPPAKTRKPRTPRVVTHEPGGASPEEIAAAAEARCEGER